MSRNSCARTALLLVLCLSLNACGRMVGGGAAPSKLSRGKQDGPTYTNEDLGLTFTVPEGWTVADRGTLDKVLGIGAQKVAEGSPFRKATAAAMQARTKGLLLTSEHPAGAPVQFNTNMLALAESVKGFRKIKTAKAYLEANRDTMKRTGQGGSADGPIYHVKMGGEVWAVMDQINRAGGMVIKQRFFALLREGHGVLFILSYRDKKDLGPMLASFKTLKLEPAGDTEVEGALTLAELAAKDGVDLDRPAAQPRAVAEKGANNIPEELQRLARQPAKLAGVPEALSGLRGTKAHDRSRALRRLKDAPVEEERRKEVTEAVVPLLKDRGTARDAIAILDKWGTEECVGPLIGYLQQRRTRDSTAIGIICRFKDKRAIPFLVEQLTYSGRNEDVKKALAAHGAEGAKAVLPLINHHSTMVGDNAMDVLELCKTQPAPIAAQCVKDLEAKEEAGLSNVDKMHLRTRRRNAIERLVKIEPDDRLRTAVLTALAPELEERNPDRTAVKAVMAWSARDQTGLLLKCAQHENRHVAAAAMDRLIELKEPKAIALACQGLMDVHKYHTAKEQLKKLGKAAEAEVARYLRHKDWQTRKRACEVLGEIGTARCLKVLKLSATKDPNSIVRGEAKKAYYAIVKRK